MDTPSTVDPAVLADALDVSSHCRNCGHTLSGKYCSSCGQEDFGAVLSMREMIRDMIGEYITWDSKMWRTLRPLLFNPGFLTKKYFEGKREYYVLPTRLYVIVSVFIFLLAISLGGTASMGGAAGQFTILEVQEAVRITGLTNPEVLDRLGSRFGSVFAIVTIVSVILFSLVITLTEIRKHRFYIEHLVFSLHMSTFGLLAIPIFGVLLLVIGDIVAWVMLATGPVYLTIALRRVYADAWWIAALKGTFLSVVFIALAFLNTQIAWKVAWILTVGV